MKIEHVEPLSWWIGLQTPLQLMLHGEAVGACDVRIEGGGMRPVALHRAESPNYLFVDLEIDPQAAPGRRWILLSGGGETLRIPYDLQARREGSRERQGFTAADAVYLLMPDRFADGDPSIDSTPDTADKAMRNEFFGRHGGDLAGMRARLDYVAELGMTAVWPTPLLLDNEPHASYHGYACADYYRIDPRFGTNEAYRAFVAEAHGRGLKVIMDVVTNHCGAAHWWMRDLPFADWIHRFETFTPTNHLHSACMDPHAARCDRDLQESGWFDRSMPDMNLDNPFVLNYFRQWAVWWTEYAGLDGLRVDTYPYNEKEPMSRWCASVRREYPNLNIVGECWTENVPQLAYWQGGQTNRDGFDSHLPALMDFPLCGALRRALTTGSGMKALYETLSNDFLYADLSQLMIFFGNHDTERLADLVRGDLRRARIAVTLLATLRGIPQLFAGDELLFRSRDRSQGHGGLRVDFPGGWAEDPVDLFDEGQHEGDAAALYAWTKRLFRWRRTKRVLHRGRLLHFASDDNTYAFFRYDETEAVFVFVNNARGRRRIPWSRYAEMTATLGAGRNVLTGEAVTLSDDSVVAARDVLLVEFERLG